MSGINNNRVNAVMTSDQLANIKTLFAAIQAQLPFLVGLSPAERMSLPKINVGNKTFSEDAGNALRNSPQLFPSFLSADMLQNDLNLFNQLDEISAICRQLSERIEDTRILAGSEAYTTALSIYRIAEAASIAGMPGSKAVYQQLKERFNYRPGSATPPTPEEGADNPDLNGI
ncbi:hypothetical protein D3C71_446630 [compost metagenome]